MTRVYFLPGASGAGRFWEPLAQLLPADWEKTCLDLPGLGSVPAEPGVEGLEGLVRYVLTRIEREGANGAVDLVAQSMGGVVAVQLALRRPDLVRRLVLVATSGGIDLAPFGVFDWRPEYREAFPDAAPWVTTYRDDHSDAIQGIQAPTLLIWAEDDAISPPPVGRRLASLLPNVRLVVLPGGDHMFARDRPAEVAPHVERHLAAPG